MSLEDMGRAYYKNRGLKVGIEISSGPMTIRVVAQLGM